MDAFEEVQNARERLLDKMLQEFNEGRSKSYYCIAATVLEVEELEAALVRARKDSARLEIKDKSRILHSILDKIAEGERYNLKLRKSGS